MVMHQYGYAFSKGMHQEDRVDTSAFHYGELFSGILGMSVSQ